MGGEYTCNIYNMTYCSVVHSELSGFVNQCYYKKLMGGVSNPS